MTDLGPELLLDLGIAAAVAVVQGFLFWRARLAARRDHGAPLESHEQRFVDDVIRRARRGSAPDWTWYRSELDRLLEPVDDRLRVLAAAALATGLGGTIVALIAHLLGAGPGADVDPATVIPGMGVALFGSLAGVVNHLAIVLWLLPTAETRFHRVSETLIRRLRETEEEHPPAETLIQKFQEELGSLRDVLGGQFADAFAEAVPEFPRVVERLAEVVERQASTVDGAMEDLKESSKLVASSSKRLRPAAEKLAAASEDLVAMPDRLASVLSATRQQWIEELHEEQRAANQDLRELLSDLSRTWMNREQELLQHVQSIARASERLPDEFAERLRFAADDLGTRFGQEARQYNRELAKKIDQEHAKLLGHVRDHEREWQNTLGDSVRRVLDELSSEVEERLIARLEEVSGEISGASGKLAEVAGRFHDAHEAWRRSHQEALDSWREVGERVEGAAGTLANGEAALERSVVALNASAGHLERVARLTEEFETALKKSLREVTAQHLDDLEPVYGKVSRLVEELESTRGRFDGILGQQSEFIRGLIQQILAGRGAMPPGEPEAQA
jgi:ABC-type transporter Mla subunit MlaD